MIGIPEGFFKTLALAVVFAGVMIACVAFLLGAIIAKAVLS